MTRLPMRVFFVCVLVVVALGLSGAVLDMPLPGSPLQPLVETHLQDTGVQHAVTAVLLNYRGYDTLLEMVVLFIAMLGAWGLSGRTEATSLPESGPVLTELVSLLVPVLVVVAAYLLWVGAYAPGGAFQSGAVLAGAGVLLSLRDPDWQHASRRYLSEALLLAGISVFILVGLASVALGGQFLQYPKDWAGTLILFIEAAAMLSIAVTLHILFVGTARAGDGE